MQKRFFSWLVCWLAGWVHKELRWWTDQLSSNAKQSVPSCCQSSSSVSTSCLGLAWCWSRAASIKKERNTNKQQIVNSRKKYIHCLSTDVHQHSIPKPTRMQSYIPSSHRSPPLSPLATAQYQLPLHTALNLYYEFVIHPLNPLCSLAKFINPIPLIMNFVSRTSSLGSRAISCLSNKILHTNTTTSPSVFFFLQTSNMGTKAMLKTNKAAAKRIRVRGSGSVKRWELMHDAHSEKTAIDAS